jgi:hypothetical protein
MDQKVNDDEIDLRALIATLLNHWKLILSMLLLGLLGGLYYAQSATPIYKTNSLIQVDKKSSGVSALGADVAGLLNAQDGSAQTEVEIINSRMILWPVINQLHLDLTVNQLKDSFLDKLLIKKSVLVSHTDNGVGNLKIGLWIAEFNVPLAYQNKIFTLTAIDSQNFKLISPDGAEFTGKVATASRFKTSAGNIDIQVTSLAPGYSYNLSKLTPAKAIENLRANLAVAEGLTVSQLTSHLASRLSRYLKHPDPQVRVLSYRGHKFYVDGQVKSPGQYDIADQPVNLYTAISMAGGTINTSDTNNIQLIRDGRSYNFGFKSLQNARVFVVSALLLSRFCVSYIFTIRVKVCVISS